MASRARRPRARRRGRCARRLAPDARSRRRRCPRALARGQGLAGHRSVARATPPSWRIGLHRRTAPLRAIRRGEGLPSVAAAIAFAVGLVNLASALTPTIAWRHHLLLQLEPMEAVPVFHTLAVPASIALVVVAFYLRARRHRAWQLAIGLMLALAAIQLLKGLDFEEAALSLGAAGLLWWGRDAFYVRHRPLRAAPPVGDRSDRRRRRLRQPRRLGDRLRPSFRTSSPGSRSSSEGSAWRRSVTLTVLLFRPLGSADGASVRRGAQRCGRPRPLARAGHARVLQAPPRRALPLLRRRPRLSRLPRRERRDARLRRSRSAPTRRCPGLVRETCGVRRDARAAVRGARRERARCCRLYRRAGMRAMYLGDEAIVDTRTFSLEGRAIRKVRQSVHRLEAAGFTTSRRSTSTSSTTVRSASSRTCRRAGATARRSAASRWRWTPCAAAHQAGSVVVVGTRRRRRRCAGSSTSSRASGGRRCRCR